LFSKGIQKILTYVVHGESVPKAFLDYVLFSLSDRSGRSAVTFYNDEATMCVFWLKPPFSYE